MTLAKVKIEVTVKFYGDKWPTTLPPGTLCRLKRTMTYNGYKVYEFELWGQCFPVADVNVAYYFDGGLTFNHNKLWNYLNEQLNSKV